MNTEWLKKFTHEIMKVQSCLLTMYMYNYTYIKCMLGISTNCRIANQFYLSDLTDKSINRFKNIDIYKNDIIRGLSQKFVDTGNFIQNNDVIYQESIIKS